MLAEAAADGDEETLRTSDRDAFAGTGTKVFQSL